MSKQGDVFPSDIDNPFNSDTPGTATHLSTWDMDTEGQEFIWTKKSYTIKSEYEYELNLVHISLYHNNNHINDINKQMHSQIVSVENITRITQQAITEYLESW